MPFLLPRTCPANATPMCSYIQEINYDMEHFNSDDEKMKDIQESGTAHGIPQKQTIHAKDSSQTTSALHKQRKRWRKLPVVDSDCRRSDRLKDISKGFKRSSCPNKDCFACAGAPPTLSPKIIKDLGSKFCNMGPETLSEAALSSRKAKKVTIKKSVSGKAEDKKAGSNNNSKSSNGRKTPEEKDN